MQVNSEGGKGLPPGPTDHFDIQISPEYFDKIEWLFAEFGEICRVRGAKRKSDSILINQPDYLKHVLLANSGNYHKGVGFERVKLLLGNGIIVSDGAFWRRQRRMIQPAFHKSHIEHLSGSMLACNQDLCARWEASAASGEPVNLSRAVNDLSLQIILLSLFSEDYASMCKLQGGNPFGFLVDNSARDMQVVLKFRASSHLIVNLIKERRAQRRFPADLLSAFMNAIDKDSGLQMTDQEVVDEVMTIIVAGYETSASTLTWLWYLLSQNPTVEAMLHQEVDTLSSGSVPSFEEVQHLQYARQIIEETIRLYPPVWLFTRKALAADNIGGYTVPAGTDIFISPYYLHRNRQYWGEDAASFKPERFTPAANKKRHRFAYVPFSAGPRRCIGDIFGIIEMQIHLGIMARQFRLRLVPGQAVELDAAVNLRSKNDIFVFIERR